MGCDFPLTAFRSTQKHERTGKPLLTFNPLKALNSTNPINIPCGRCTGCRLEKSRQWAVRCMHEASLYEQNSYITLTFSREHLPVDYSVHVRDWQLFMKKLRKALGDHKVRFYMCGEYGDEKLRPHYHAILFNYDFPDKVLFQKTPNGDLLYTSRILSSLWPYGHSTTGAVTYQSAAYVSRYVLKKISGPKADEYYLRVHPDHGFICRVKPEFTLMSRRPGIGAPWLERYKSDVYPSDFVVVDGRKMNPPRFYDQKLTEEELENYKRRRKLQAVPYKPHKTTERRRAKAAVRDARIRPLKRSLQDH